jgi:hypothetical protein
LWLLFVNFLHIHSSLYLISTFNNILVILWRSVLLVEETGGPRENHWPVASHWQTLSHNVVLSTSHHECLSQLSSRLCRMMFSVRWPSLSVLQVRPKFIIPPLVLVFWQFNIRSKWGATMPLAKNDSICIKKDKKKLNKTKWFTYLGTFS